MSWQTQATKPPRYPGDDGQGLDLEMVCRAYFREWRKLARRVRRPARIVATPPPPPPIVEPIRPRKRKPGSSPFIGVHLDKPTGRWKARVDLSRPRRKSINVGVFDSAELAARAREPLARSHGASLNFPEVHGGES